MLQSWVEQTAMQNSAIRNTCWKYLSSDVSKILLTDEKIFTVATLKNLKNHQLYATAATTQHEIWCA